MRRVTDANRVHGFMRRLGQRAETGGRVYFTGGATALLMGWRSTTIDIDLTLGADAQHLLRLVPALKEELEINVKLAALSDFIPELPGWRERSRFIQREGVVDFGFTTTCTPKRCRRWSEGTHRISPTCKPCSLAS